ncbi:MAG: hypothetical protein P8K80_09870 [Phycisphaerales bacterium]|nr:hypothetical protein [Phycisphaerales bacterium]
MEVVRNWIIMLAALALSIIAFLLIEPTLLSTQGDFGPTVMQAQSPVAACLAMLAALIVGTIIAVGVARIFQASTGLLVLGIGLGWLALQLQTIQHVALHGSFNWLVLEGLIWSVVILAIVVIMARSTGPMVQPMLDPGEAVPDWAASTEAIKMGAAGIAALPIVWIIAQSPLKGQVLAATIIGSVAAGLVGRLVAPTVQPYLLFAGVCLFGALGQWVAGIMIPPDQMEGMVTSGLLPHIALPLPIDYAAGSLIGVPLGLQWGSSFLRKDDPSSQEPTAASS